MSVPGKPVISLAPRASNQTLEFRWGAPTSDGGSPITGYRLQLNSETPISIADPNARYYKVTGLTNGTNYIASLEAENANGFSEKAYFRLFQPGNGVPAAPSSVSASSLGVSSAIVSWTPPSVLPDSSIFWYYIQSISNNVGDPVIKRTGNGVTQSNLLIHGLNSNSIYQFLVKAVNCPGYSPAIYTSSINMGFFPTQFGTLSLWLDMSSSSNYLLSNASTSNISTFSDLGNLSLVYNTRYGSNMPFLSTTLNNFSTATLFSSRNGFRQSTIVSSVKHVFFVGRQGAASTSNALFGLSTATSSWANATSANYVPQRAADASLFITALEPFTATWAQNINIAPLRKPFILNLNNINFTPNFDGIGYSVSPNNGGWNGDLAEVICYSNALTTQQISTINGYLINKWFPSVSSFSPSSIASCVFWVDASNPNGFTMSGGNVSTIRDFSKIGGTQNIVKGTANPLLGSTINGLSTISVGNGRALGQSTIVSSVKHVFFVGRHAPNQPIYPALFGSDTAYHWHATSPNFIDTTAQNVAPGVYSASNSVLYNKNSQYTESTFSFITHPPANSVFLLTINPSGVSTFIQGIGYERGFAGRGWLGDVAEVICYDSLLTVQQQEQVEFYLKKKWAIYPQPISTPTQLGSMQLWLDASDPYGNGTAPAQSTIISTLFDKSGLGRNAVATGNVYYTSTGISSRPSLRLVPDAFYSGTITPRMTGTTLYTFLVFSGDVGSDIWGRIISMGSNNTETFNIGRSNGSANTITSYRYTAANVNTTYLFTSTTVGDIPNGACITAIYDGTTTGQLRVNGISYTSATATDFNSSLNIANYVIGKHVSSLGNPFTSRWQGFLSEVLVYSTLTLDQVASVEAYLKRKWNV